MKNKLYEYMYDESIPFVFLGTSHVFSIILFLVLTLSIPYLAKKNLNENLLLELEPNPDILKFVSENYSNKTASEHYYGKPSPVKLDEIMDLNNTNMTPSLIPSSDIEILRPI